MSSRWLIVLAGLAVGGCSAESTDKDDQVASTYASELTVTGAAYLGTISSGQSKTSYYYDPPKYRAYGFTAKAGDNVVIDVTSPDGDAMAWLTDSTYATTYASNDDASSRTLDSHIAYTVPQSAGSSKSYRIVFRDYDRLDATFHISLAIKSSTPPPPSCDPAKEPLRDYRYTPSQCGVVRYTCPAGWHAFQNACGCGCE
jgi:hypothetical protein